MAPIRRKKNPILIALILSVLLVHVPLFLLLVFFGGRVSEESAADLLKKNAIIVDLKNASDLPVVDIAKPRKREKPDKASAQALYDSKVARETTSSGRKPQPGPAVKNAKPAATSSAMPLPPRTPDVKRDVTKHLPPHNAAESQAPPTKAGLQDELKALKNQQRAKEIQEFKKFESKTAMFAPPTNFNGGGGGEFLPDYKIGDRTYVNALANPQIAYYVELKRKFKLTWNPVPALRAQINQITKGKVTVVMGVSLDASGKLAGLQMIRGSGLSAYDAEARRTVKASAPFSKPPSSILQKDGQVHMAWTFVVYL